MSLEEEILAVTKSNVVGTVHLFSLFVPLLLKGNHKKVVHISSGMADLDLVRQLHIQSQRTLLGGKGRHESRRG